MNDTARVMNAMITYYAGDVRRVNHFIKVYGFAKAIGEMEGLPEREQSILEIAALTHDIGIKNSEAKYNSAAGHYQELEGPPEAREMLESLGLDTLLIDRVCWLIGHHHTYGDLKERDHLILIEADFLVNACEDGMAESSIISVRDKIFRTATGKRYLDTLYFKK
jgi:HD superfamily phosphodiesterase